MDFSNINTESKGMDKLLGAMKKTQLNKSDNFDNDKENEWRLQRDKDDNGYAQIRFIPSPDGELFMEIRNHGYKNEDTGRWYIENCPKTLDWDNGCPCCEYVNNMKNQRDWKIIPEKEQNEMRKFFAKTSYWANILVEKDPANPENEGKVFKYRFGKKILEQIAARATDDPLDETKGINVFDLEDGASFKLKSKRVGGYVNYDSSSFATPSVLKNGEKYVEQGFDLGYIRSESNFKDYEILKKRFYATLNVDAPENVAASAEDVKTEDEKVDDKVADDSVDEPEINTDDGDDDDMAYFADLMNED